MDECIINTLSYFDIFDYPLTFSEIKKYLCCPQNITDDELYELIQAIPVIQEQNGFYYFLGRNEITEKRMERNERSFQKFAKAKVIGKLLSFIPTIEYIGISGSLSMNNASESDDIDLFFITKKNSLWISRFLVSAILVALRQKRGRHQKNVKDKICPNMFMEMDKLSFANKRRTPYTAHELVQLKTLFNRNETHEFLLMKNKWLYNFFPNMMPPQYKKKKVNLSLRIFQRIILPLEKFLYILQLFYMKSHRTVEIITMRNAFFHPLDRQTIILGMHKLRYKRYKKLYADNLWVDRDEARFYMDEKKIRILN